MFGLLAVASFTLWEAITYTAALAAAAKVTLEAAEIARRLRPEKGS